MEVTQTNRGFDIIDFKDRYGKSCSLQKSSLAGEDAIWLGTNGDQAEGKPSGQPWQTVTDDQIAAALGFDKHMFLIPTRMHLTRDQVAALLPILQRFVDTGQIS